MKMKKIQVLKNWKTEEYLTNRYDCWWSRDIRDAYQYDMNENMDDVIDKLVTTCEYDEPLENCDYIELVIFYCK